MSEIIDLGNIAVHVTRKNIKNVHLSVHPPDGHVTLAAPTDTRLDVVRAYVISRLGWIRDQQGKLTQQAREVPREYVGRESHYVWGRRYLLNIVQQDGKQGVVLDHKRIFLQVRPGADTGQREKIMYAWHKTLLHQAVPPLLEKWQRKLGVTVTAYFLQKMKTRWGSCNHRAGHIRLNTELVKKPRDLLEYVVVHEMMHLLEPTHSVRFVMLLDEHYPGWREARAELNALPLAAQVWKR